MIKLGAGVKGMAKATRLKNPPESPRGEQAKSGQILYQYELESYLSYILQQYFANGSGVKQPFKTSVEHITTKTGKLLLLISKFPEILPKSNPGLRPYSKGQRKNQ